LAAIEAKFWETFCRGGDGEDLLAVHDKSFSVDFADGGQADLLDVLMPIFRDRTVAEWMDVARAHDIPLCPANCKRELLDDPHLGGREILHHSEHPVAGPYSATGWPAPVTGQPFDQARHAPSLGEHTYEVLGELGYPPERIEGLRERGVV
jgi:crotonobetainyl-CoA:carnitine CoA-transferase CaiB-like acyl-CoA transferase